MNMKIFDRKDAEEILKPCGLEKYIECNDEGVWPAVQRDLTLIAETEMLRWRPARELQDAPGAPKVTDTPMLPFPFTANDLAAFMLKGVGALVGDFYGDWCNGSEPNPEMLQHIDPDTQGRQALMAAYASYQAAKLIVLAGPDGQPDIAAMVRHLIGTKQDDSNSSQADRPRPLQRGAAQDAAILNAIRNLGHDPKYLPKNPSGKPGVKAAVQQALVNDRLFKGATVFKKAWERLAEREEIVISGQVSP